jgi:outer membrane protein OmpA-like peptidoglycan-associated protein
MKKIYLGLVLAILSISSIKAQVSDSLFCKIDSLRCKEEGFAFHKAFESLNDTTTSALKTHWLSNKAKDNWFISVEGGLDWFRSENWRDIDWKDRFRFTGGITFGKWFNPVWGLRMAISGGKYQSLAYPNYVTWYVGQNHPGPAGYSLFQSYITYYDEPTLVDFFNNRMFQDAKPYKSGYLYNFMWGEVTIDFLLNLRNLKATYDPNRFFNPVMFVGLGYAHTLKQGERTAVNSIANRMGFQFNFRLNKHWDLYITAPEVMMVPEVFDRQVGANQTQDLMINALVGLTYHFKNSKFERKLPAYPPRGVEDRTLPVLTGSDQIDLLNAKINDLQNQLAAAQSEVETNKKLVAATLLALDCCENDKNDPSTYPAKIKYDNQPDADKLKHDQKPAVPDAGKKQPNDNEIAMKAQGTPDTPNQAPKTGPDRGKISTDLPGGGDLPKKKLPLDFTPVFFTLDSYVVRESQMVNVESAVEYLREFPDRKLTLAAYADIQTGNPKHNWTLSQNRVNAVAKVMIERYKVDKDRLILKFYGDTEQPYEINENNRVVVFVK